MINQKLEALKSDLKAMGSVAVAYSSGVDSTFLLSIAQEVLGDQAVAITVSSGVFPRREYGEALAFCEQQNIRHHVLEVNELDIEGFKDNPPDRCYICKKSIFSNIQKLARELNLNFVVEGSNVDDDSDYRPGHRAIKELGIQSPLRKAGLTKEEIRILSKERHLPTWSKASFACLASRFVYGEEITKEKLHMVEQAEDFLMTFGFTQFRVRIHGMMARIELLEEDLTTAMMPENRVRIADKLLELGFAYVTLDMKGFRSGSMNDSLKHHI